MNETLFNQVIETVEKKMGCVRDKSQIMASIITATAIIQAGQAVDKTLQQIRDYSVPSISE